NRIALRRGVVGEVHEARKRGVKRRDAGTELRDDTAAGTHTRAAGRRWRAVGIHTHAVEADAGGASRNTGTDTTQSAATLGAAQDFARQQRAVALHFDIDI